MQSKKALIALVLTVLLLVAIAFPAAGAPSVGSSQGEVAGKIESLVLEELEAYGQTDYFIWMVEKADLSPATQLPTKLAKGQFVFETLRATAERTQKDLRRFLDGQGVDYQPFYIANKILVRGGSEPLLIEVAGRQDVERITANHEFQLEEPFIDPKAPIGTEAIEPNITFVNADDVWALGVTGAGTVMAGNDTGLDWDHPALINQYRGWNGVTADHNYNWWDATGTYPTVPDDGHGHGTHTTGTMVGDDGGSNQIGMAPGAQTVHCKNMTNSGSGSDATFTECFEWDLAPWDLSGANPDPAMAPDAINNSWGYWGGGQNQFRDEIQALHAAGILVEVSAGNEGSSCGSLRSPGDYWEVLTTGSINHAAPYPGTMTGFSSRGPSSLDPGEYFPDITAPGENIRSSVPGGGYEGGWSGTSMAGPHATALVGLMWSACPSLRGQVYPTMEMIRDTATPVTSYVGSCGGDYVTGPNNDWGYGTIDALAAVQMAVAQCTGVGTLAGNVYDNDTMAPIEGATVTAVWEGGFEWSVVTDATGSYGMDVFIGFYDVTAEAFAYVSQTAAGVEVLEDQTTELDFYLVPVTEYEVSGYLTDAISGDPLDGQVQVLDTPLPPAFSDPTTGFYTIMVPEGVYTFRATAALHQPEEREVNVDHSQMQDFGLEPLPCILLVDDDQDGPDVRSYYTGALDTLGLDYNVWDVSGQGDPTANDLAGYAMVFWFTGYPYSQTFTSGNEAAVGAYLDAGGKFFMSSQDYLWDYGLTPFGQDYLHIASFSSDVSQTTVTGQNVFAGLGPYALSYPFTNYSDIVQPDAQAQVAFVGNQGNAAISYDEGSFQTVFFGFPFEAIPGLQDRADVLGTIVDWFGGCAPPDDTMHVEGIAGFFSTDYMGRPVLRMHVLVEDAAGVPVSSVAVDVSIWAPDGGPYERSRFTKNSGNARFHWGSMASGTWTLCVDWLTLAGYTYNPDDNEVTCQDWYY